MKIYDQIIKISRSKKIIIILLLDFLCILIASYASISLRYEDSWNKKILIESLPFIYFSPVALILSAKISGIHRVLLRTTNIHDVYKLFIYSLIISLIYAFINFSFLLLIPRSVPIIFLFIFLILIIFYRIMGIIFLKSISLNSQNIITNVIIFGAGKAGIQLLNSVMQDQNIKIIAFIDDDKNLSNTTISNVQVFSRKNYLKGIKLSDIDELWIATPSISDLQRRNILEFATSNFKKTRSLPSISKLLLQSTIKNALYDISPDDFLGRDKINITNDLYLSEYKDRTILVSGAGGSIGGEISRQLLNLEINKIILFEVSEYALYQIEQVLKDLNKDNSVDIVPCLGSVCDKIRIQEIINFHNVDVIIHAAAYKHVPLVEANISEGFKNNTIGTNVLVNAAIKNNLERFIFISSDKAVRPSSVMGKTKRAAELIIQAKSKENINIIFSIIRFGNVLGSSGSVIPLFNKQIEDGGPVTVTDPEMTRYFMALNEAVNLVLLAGSFRSNGNVYLLDMGKPIKILDLAINMIKLAGYSIKDKTNPNGDIEIKITKIRPGEKLFEELLTQGKFEDTSHPKVKLADEPFLEISILLELVSKIELLIEKNDYGNLKDILDTYRISK